LEAAGAVLQGPHAREEMEQKRGDVKAGDAAMDRIRPGILLSFNDKKFW
jgi:hypothetical protein